MENFIPCNKCTNTDTPGYILDGHILQECECRKIYEKYKKFHTYMLSRGFPEKYLCLKEDDYFGDKSKKSLEAVLNLGKNSQKLVETGGQLFLYGESYTQKTAASVFFARKAVCNRTSVYYTSFAALLSALTKNSFSDKKDSNLDSMETRISNTDILIIDDILDLDRVYIKEEEGKMSYPISVFLQFLLNRINRGKVQVYISTQNPRSVLNKVRTVFTPKLTQLITQDSFPIEFKDEFPKDVRNSHILKSIKLLSKGKKDESD